MLLLVLGQSVTFTSCATPTSPNGGDRDSIGPVLIAEETTPNFQTNFRPEEIVLTFDEWVELDNKQEIIISPPIDLGENRPFLRRRSLIIPLAGIDLLDSVTYVVNVGSAIKDLNEGNPTENLRFVFATGPVLDTATLSGTLVDDFSGEPLDGATFTLYGNLADTATTTANPTYFAQTDEEGRFTVYNIRPGVYRPVGLVRNNGATNYYVDFDGTFPPLAVGFSDSLVTVRDGDNLFGALRVSPVAKPTKVTRFDTTAFGQLDIVLNQDARLVDFRAGRSDYLRRDVKDTLRLFYPTPAADTIYVGRDPEYRDTLYFAGQPAGQANPPRLDRSSKGKIGSRTGAFIELDQPIVRIDTAGIVLSRDSLRNLPLTIVQDTTFSGRLLVRHAWEAGKNYVLEVLPEALTAQNGLSNPDTLRSRFAIGNPTTYGTLTLKLRNLDPTKHYILRLVKGDEPLVDTRRYVDLRFDYDVTYYDLPAAEYRVELLEDTNNNRRYDSGDFRFGRQPETVRRFTIAPLRANWEVEEEIDLGG